MARAGSCGNDDMADEMYRPRSNMVLKIRGVGRALSRRMVRLVLGKRRGHNGRMSGTG